MLNIWLDMNDFIKKDTTHKGNEIFLNNRFIHNSGKTYFNENLFLKNTYRLYFIIDGKGTLKSDTYFRCMGLEEEEISMLKEIYGNIPEEWKIDLTKRQISFHDLKIEFMFTKKSFQFESVCSKNLYRACIQKMQDVPVSFQNLHSSYNLSVKEIEKVFVRPRISTLDNKLREFQFKLLYKIVYVNRYLYRFQFISSDKCSFCGKEEETYRHIFLECEMVRNLWDQCSDSLDIPILKDMSWKEVHIGLDEIAEDRQMINHVVLLIKYLIFISREKKKPPSIEEIKEKILKSKQEERKSATERNTLTFHYKKWEHLKVNMDNMQENARDEERGVG